MHARVVLGVGKGVLYREVSSVEECPYREFHYILQYMSISGGGVCVGQWSARVQWDHSCLTSYWSPTVAR